MADEKQKAESAPKADRKKSVEASVAVEAKYARSEHLGLAHAMHGVPSHVVAGALAVIEEREGEARDEYTKSEIEQAIRAFSSRKV